MSWLYPKQLVGVLLLAALLLPGVADAKGSRSGDHGYSSVSRSSGHNSHSMTPASSNHSSGHAEATGGPRDSQLTLGKGLRCP